MAAALTAAGARVTITGRTEAALAGAVKAGDAAGFLVLDAMDEAAVAAGVSSLGPVDILVANAGAAESAPFLKSDAAMFRRMIDLKSDGVVPRRPRRAAGHGERAREEIIAIASMAG